MGYKMITYKTTAGRYSAELAQYLIWNGKPFHFNGDTIEFIAGDLWMKMMYDDKPKFRRIEFEKIKVHQILKK